MPETVVQLVSQYGYPILFATVLFMNAGVPIPGHITYLTAAIMSGRGALSLAAVMAVALVAAIAGAVAGYYLGRRGGRKLVDTYGPRVGLTARRVARMDLFFERHGMKAIFLTRFFVVIRTFGHVFAGVNRVPERRFLLVTIAGAIAWAGLFGAAGYLFGDQWHVFEGWFERIGLGVLIAAVVIAAGAVLVRRWRSRRA